MRLKKDSNIGLYDSRFEKESCGLGFVAQINKEPSHQNIKDALTILCNMDHRGARGSEPNSGDGAGILTGMPHTFFAVKIRFPDEEKREVLGLTNSRSLCSFIEYCLVTKSRILIHLWSEFNFKLKSRRHRIHDKYPSS